MARLTDEQINRLKQDISLQRLVEAQGIKLKKHGKDLLGLCPFHDDNDPSLVITPEKNLWHCLGACQTGGSVIDWTMKWEGVSFRHAAELLLNDYDVQDAQVSRVQGRTGATRPKQSTVRKLDNPFETNIEDQLLLNRVIDYYHDILKQNTEALAYVKKRGITNEAIEHFKIGVADRTLGYRLPKANRKPGAAIREQLQTIGIYRESGHEHFSGSIIIPVIDEHGNVKEVYGRKIREDLRKGTPKHLYLPGPHKGIFNRDALKASNEIILCESLIDALSFWCNGYRNVTCSYGIEGFTKEHLEAFKQNNIKRILIAYDRDAAGEEAANKLSKKLIKEGIDCYRIHFPKGMDANDYTLSMTPASKALGVVIRSAAWLGAGQGRPNVAGAGSTGATKGKKKPITTTAKEENIIGKTDSTSLVAECETVVNEVLPASPLPEAPEACPQESEEPGNDNEIIITLADRRYRIRGINKNLGYDSLKVNVMVSSKQGMHIDTIDLYQSRPRSTFIKQASIELCVNSDVIKTDLGKVLLKCETLQEDNIKKKQTPKPTGVQLTDKEKKDAFRLLKSKHLLKRIQKDFNLCGIVGENTNTLVGYLSAVSRKLDNPLAVIIQSTSAAGKSSLMEAVLRFVPDDDKHQYSAMTGQSLYYLGETNLKHKVLAIAEEEGAAQACYALKLLQSEGQLTIASTTKDPESGDLTTKEYKVEGPVMIFLTTTAIEVDEELMNRCLVLTVNEDREQTQAIHQLQRKKRTLEGLIQKTEREKILKTHQNAQRLLRSLSVVNPYAEQLTFLNDQTRTRRDHEKYLTLIDSIALLHQYQREIKTLVPNRREGTCTNNKPLQYVEVTIDDIAIANTLAHEVLGRTLDELPPQTRKLLSLIDQMVAAQCKKENKQRNHYHFSRREVREYTLWGNTQCRVHMDRLVEMEYLLPHSGRRGQRYEYELLYDGDSTQTQAHLNGLIDAKQLKTTPMTQSSRDKEGEFAGSKRPQNGGSAAPKRGDQINRKTNNNQASSDIDNDSDENAYIKGNHTDASYDVHDAQVSRVQGSTGATVQPSLVASGK